MVDYYPFVLRAVQAAGSVDTEARHGVYERARRMLAEQLRARRPPFSLAEMRAHQSGLEAAIARIEAEYAQARTAPPPRPAPPLRRAPAAESRSAEPFPEQPEAGAEDRPQRPAARSRRGLRWAVAAAVLVAVIGAGGYAAWTTLFPAAVPTVVDIQAARNEPPLRRRATVRPSDQELAPGVDGGSTDADLSFIFRRQRVFYRTTLPTGTVVVDKPQHFIYLVLPNSVALRYGIGVGTSCAETVGMRKVERKAEWPEWTPPPGFARTGPMPGGPGNPLGARLLELGDDGSRIHGTNAPKTIGEDVSLGCVRLVNDDVADLYNRVPVGTRVVMR
jgi:lipoprotein-anchoring transpeptidase ErfK/SrfK